MEDTLELTDPEHPDAQQAAATTAYLLISIHESRERKEQAQQSPDENA